VPLAARSHGLTIVELLVALTLMGLVSVIALGLLRMSMVGHRRLAAYIESSYVLRTSVNVLRSQLLELDAGDPSGSDILDMGRGFVEYRRMVGLLFTCVEADTLTGRLSVFRDDTLRFGDVGLVPTPGRDEIVVLSTGNRSTLSDDRWFRMRLTNIARSNECPGGEPSLTFTSPDVPAAPLHAGAPLRVIQRFRLRVYTDAVGDWWIGSQQSSAGGGWSTTQPVVGPLVVSGLELTYYDRSGAGTSDPAEVARIGVNVVVGGRVQNKVRALRADIALRNNPRP
jgi:prepilin-type N-terminal cleavage/methylation domain-containing protein